jgi:hypothetical protein
MERGSSSRKTRKINPVKRFIYKPPLFRFKGFQCVLYCGFSVYTEKRRCLMLFTINHLMSFTPVKCQHKKNPGKLWHKLSGADNRYLHTLSVILTLDLF